MKLGNYRLNDAFRIWDTSGLGDGAARDQVHKKRITNLLCRNFRLDGRIYGFIDMVLVIIEGANRDMGTTYNLLNEVIAPNIQEERILVVINQVYSIQRCVKEATGVSIPKPVYYSAEYGYNVKAVFDFIIDNIPVGKKSFV